MSTISCIAIRHEGREVYSEAGFRVPSILYIDNEYYYYEQNNEGTRVQFLNASGEEKILEKKEWLN